MIQHLINQSLSAVHPMLSTVVLTNLFNTLATYFFFLTLIKMKLLLPTFKNYLLCT